MPNIGFRTRELAQKVKDAALASPPYEYTQGVAPAGLEDFLQMHGNGWICYTLASIPKRSVNQCFNADCVPYYIDDDGLLQELKANGQSFTVPVWNLSEEGDVSASTFIQAKMVGNRAIADFEDCD